MKALLFALALSAVGFPALSQQNTGSQSPGGRSATPPRGSNVPQMPLGADLQALIRGSGLSADQIRARLRAQGYSETLLDSYLAGGSSPTGAPSDSVFAAIEALGLGDSLRVDSLRNRAGIRKSALDSAFVDSVMTALRDDSTRHVIRQVLRSREMVASMHDSGFVIFGADVFERESSLFNPNEAGPVPADYRVGPGDQLVLVLTGDTERSYTLPVTREGMIFVPEVGGVAVAGLMIRQLEDILRSRLGRVYSGIRSGTSTSAVTVARLGSSQISVLGDVKAPGAYTVSKLGTILTAIYAAGGPTVKGSFRNIQVQRGGQSLGRFDLYDFLTGGTARRELRLESGDVVFVPARGARVRIAGAVKRAGTYELMPGETLADLLRMAGGFRAEADQRRVQVERIVPPSQRVAAGSDRLLFDISGLYLDRSPEPLIDGDVVRVRTIADRIANRIMVLGNVWTPGAIAFTPGMKLSDALSRAGGIKPDTYREAIQIARLQRDSTRLMLRMPAPGSDSIAANGHSVDMELQPDDEIRVFSVTEYRPPRYITVSGAVRNGGEFPYREGMTVRDALMLAGGVEEGALLQEAEIARMPEHRERGATAVTLRVPLDSTFLFDRGPGGEYAGPPGLQVPARRVPEVELKPYDNLLILRQPDWALPEQVIIAGEVKYPGSYTLKYKSERLADLVQRAGGLTPDAYASGLVFIRRQDRIGRIGVDLPSALKNSRHPDNLQLMGGDSITVPTYSAVVTVEGEVNSPVTLAYVRGASIDYYIRAAGGGTSTADARRAYVMQPNGKVQSRSSFLRVFSAPPRPLPGSTVTVPKLPENARINWGSVIGTTTSVVGSVVAIIAILRN